MQRIRSNQKFVSCGTSVPPRWFEPEQKLLLTILSRITLNRKVIWFALIPSLGQNSGVIRQVDT